MRLYWQIMFDNLFCWLKTWKRKSKIFWIFLQNTGEFFNDEEEIFWVLLRKCFLSSQQILEKLVSLLEVCVTILNTQLILYINIMLSRFHVFYKNKKNCSAVDIIWIHCIAFFGFDIFLFFRMVYGITSLFDFPVCWYWFQFTLSFFLLEYW
jgi:hypothetical protein